MSGETFASVWDALEDDPAKARKLEMQSLLMIALSDLVKSWETTQKDAAARLGVSQPRLNNLLQGKFNKFTLDALLKMAVRGGLDVALKIKGPKKPKAPARRPTKKQAEAA